MTGGRRLSALAVALFAVASAGCGHDAARGPKAGRGSCAASVAYAGHAYSAEHAAVAPRAGSSLGTTDLPRCTDTNGGSGMAPEKVELLEIVGVPSTLALGWRGRDDIVLVRADADPGEWPASLRHLLSAPACDPGDEPIRLRGRLLGILDENGRTEVDLVPPYRLELRVGESSAARYDRALLTVHVPSVPTRPFDRADLDRLLAGAALALTVRCRDGLFVLA